ncbi:MAG: glutaminase A [Bacteriovorax sp.]|nr:glutaminase A [Bacteriovorax sp.]
MTDYKNLLKKIHEKYLPSTKGSLASYIPELAKIDPNLFAISITTVDGKTYSHGDINSFFTLQSTSKPFTYGLALMDHGPEFVHQRVGVEPSGEAFNSIIELEKNSHRPFNPMINSGAIAVASMIQDKLLDNNEIYIRSDRMLDLFSSLCGKKLEINEQVFLSEKKTAHRNRAIAHLLRHFDVIGNDIEESLDLYFKQCSVEINIIDLSQMAATLANQGVQPISKIKIYDEQYITDMIGLIFTCGMYDTAGAWAYQVGIPAKSGVSGAIFGVIPGVMGIAVYSPLIDDHGHSVRGVNAIKDISQELKLNIFRQQKR